MRRLILMLSCFAAAPVLAQDLTYSDRPVESCLASVSYDQQQTCIGLSAEDCMERTPGGFSTYGMGGCLSRELDYWDARLNVAYQNLITEAQNADAANADIGYQVESQEAALRQMQRAWIAFRDARCAFARSQWGGGTGGGPAAVSCLMTTTGEQTLYLEASRMGG